MTASLSSREKKLSRARLHEGALTQQQRRASLSLDSVPLAPVDGARLLGPLRRRCGGRWRRSGDDDERQRRRQRKFRRWRSPGLVRPRVRKLCSRCVVVVKDPAIPWENWRDQGHRRLFEAQREREREVIEFFVVAARKNSVERRNHDYSHVGCCCLPRVFEIALSSPSPFVSSPSGPSSEAAAHEKNRAEHGKQTNERANAQQSREQQERREHQALDRGGPPAAPPPAPQPPSPPPRSPPPRAPSSATATRTGTASSSSRPAR